MSEPLEVPLHTRGDVVGFYGSVFFFGIFPIGIYFTSSLAAALVALPFLVIFIWFLFWPLFQVFGARLIVRADRMSLQTPHGEQWSIQWRNIHAATEMSRLGNVSQIDFEVAGHDQTVTLRFSQTPLVRARVKQVIQAHLPEGVHILREVVGLKPKRSQYLAIAGATLSIGILAIFFPLQWLQVGVDPTPAQTFLSRISVWVTLGGMVAAGIGILQLMLWLAWKPRLVGNKLVKTSGLEDSLWTELLLRQTGASSTDVKFFAYPERYRSFNLARQERIAWTFTGAFALALGAGLFLACQEPPKNPNVSPALVVVVLGSMLGLVVALVAVGCYFWSRGLRRILPHIEKVVQVTTDGLFVIENGNVNPAAVVTAPRQHLQTQDSSGLNSASMELEIDGERIWIDPISMMRIEDDRLPAQQRPNAR